MNQYPYGQSGWQAPQQYQAPPEPQQSWRALPFQFTGNTSEYFRIWIVNTLLSIVTLGIYSAWAKVRRKQYFYRHTWVEGTSFDYLADPIKILKGRLVIGAIIAVLAVSQQYSPVLYVGLLVLLVFASPWLVVKALAFNARNSAFRNIRFAFAGRTGEAYSTYLKMLGIYLITCGLGYPYMQWKLTQFVVTRHYYGDQEFSWRTRSNDYFMVYLKALGMVLPAYVLFVGFGVISALSAKQSSGFEPPPPWLLFTAMGVVYAYLLIPAAFVRARIGNLVYGGIQIENHVFSSNQRARELIKLYAVNAVAILFSLGLMIPWAQIRLAKYRAEHLTLHALGPLFAENLGLDQGRSALGDAANDLGDLDLDLGLG
ncbi:MAG: YjgN family protein [Myxococcota bacterium]|jgi:uncharacterized membrane protein YjgN (DUF898 family)|nr:YjgN family protein [Myxococcota bacterium]